MLGLLLSRVVALRDAAGNIAWNPLVGTARTLCLALLSRIEIGRLEIIDLNGDIHICGQESGSGNAETVLTLHKDTFWLRLALFADMGFAESYLLSEVSCPDLVAFFKIFILNRPYISNSTITSSITDSVTGLIRSTNTLSNARLNIAAHYDISNAMFAAFLSPDMTYSCPIWRSKADPAHVEETLEEAQDRKLARFIKNAKIKRGDRVLEIGTGWGSLAIKAVKETGCTVISLTLSEEQKKLAEQKIEDEGMSDKIQVLLCDYRKLAIPAEGRFDKIISIEMLEAVGREFLVTYFDCIDRLLKEDGGIAVFQCITIPEARYESYSKGNDFIRQYIFPGGHLPSVSQLVASIATGSKGKLVVDDIENIGAHYAKTLRLWKEKFLANFTSQIKPALLREHENMTKTDVELFRRKWEYYFTYCEAGFATKTLGDVIITVGREGAMEMIEDVPL
ncbi:cyclopropane-fatty-acyl-phospholipid synthase [Microthyrium microscopicum]|uniref:Cyclopropane-fatty-acyl-phospholipid synthase n=1 Tax=Microthyrium microscopicum TaxID=703497 RepID=A0A6A6UKY3_9PEZI|nr:cyclopropane-fatty-acyl-phospholipid synthase [Microthyrium microscopicum]